MNTSTRPARSSLRKIEKLTDLLDQIQHLPEPVPELLQSFQARYNELPREGKAWFFDAVIRRLETKRDDLEEPLREVVSSRTKDPFHWSLLVTELRRRLESPRLRAFRRFLGVSGGFKFLVDLRADVLYAQRQTSLDLDLDPLEEELSHLFNTWFQQGFLFLQEITRESSFKQIHFLKEHDMVHPVASLDEMVNRLGRDRRCFALYHRAMPEEPVVFIEAALTKGLAGSIDELIWEPPPGGRQAKPDTVIFYSINNTQNGLAGLGLGKVLIFQVVDAVKRDHPAIKTFATLSPVTGFWPRYLRPLLRGADEPFLMKRKRLEGYFPERTRKALMKHHGGTTDAAPSDFFSMLIEILSLPAWIQDPGYRKWLERPLTEICYFYIAHERNRQGKPLNPVANFHLGNGARVDTKNIHFGANPSERGLADSCGMMVNYVYSRTWLQQIGRTMKSWLPWNA